tara:strand:+ start:299 stop:670 length:372 start_codon:yes stop_codon:yes gene_type:complete
MKKKSTENLKETTTQPKKNLGGRPKGSKNSLTILQEAAVNGVMTKVLKSFDNIVKTTIKRAEDGDTVCLKILWDRVVPARKAVEHISNPANQGVTITVQGVPKITKTEVIDAQFEEIGVKNAK